MAFWKREVEARAGGDHTGSEIARQLKAGNLPPTDVNTREAFDEAVATMFRTGQPFTVPSAAHVLEWCGPLDELPDDELVAAEDQREAEVKHDG